MPVDGRPAGRARRGFVIGELLIALLLLAVAVSSLCLEKRTRWKNLPPSSDARGGRMRCARCSKGKVRAADERGERRIKAPSLGMRDSLRVRPAELQGHGPHHRYDR